MYQVIVSSQQLSWLMVISVTDGNNFYLLGSELEENNKNGSKKLDAMTLIKEGKVLD